MRAKPLITLFCSVICAGCAVTNYNPNNIIDLTDEQWIEDASGNKCRETEMLIYPDRIEFYLPGCSIKRVVKTKPHLLPTPSPKSN